MDGLLLLFYSSHKSSEVTTKEAPIFSKAEFANICCCETAVFTAFEISLGYLILKAHVSITFFKLRKQSGGRAEKGVFTV